MSGMPGIQVKAYRHNDGSSFIAIQRGSLFWTKIRTDEVVQLCNDLMDALEDMEKK